MEADQKTLERLVFADLTQDVYQNIMETLEAQILRLMQKCDGSLTMQMSRYFDQASEQFNARLMQLAEGTHLPPSSPVPLTPEQRTNAPMLNRTKSFINAGHLKPHDIPKVKKALFQDGNSDDNPVVIDDISSEEDNDEEYAPSSDEIEDEEYTETEVLVYETDTEE